MGTHSDWVLGTVFSPGRAAPRLGQPRHDVKLTEVATQRFIDNVTSITPGALKGGLMAVDRRPMKDEDDGRRCPSDSAGTRQPKVYDELVVAGADGTPRLYKMHREVKRVIGDDSNQIREFEAMPGRVSASRSTPDGTQFAAGSSLDGKGEVRVYDTNDRRRRWSCEKVTGPAYAVALAPERQG